MSAQENASELTAFEATYVNYLASNSPAQVLVTLQNSKPDSNASNTEKAQYYGTLSQVYYNLSNPQKSLEYAQLSLTFVDASKQPWLYNHLLTFEALAYEVMGQYIEGLKSVNNVILWAEANNKKPELLFSFYTRGIIHTNLIQYSKGLEDFHRAYALATDDTGRVTRADIAGMQAQVYAYRREYTLAIPLFEEAKVAYRQSQKWGNLSIVLFGLGKANRNIGMLKLGQSQLQESLSLAQDIGDKQGVGYALKELATINVELQNYAQAKLQLLDAMQIFSLTNNMHNNFDVAINLTSLSLRQNNLREAEEYLREAKHYLKQDLTLYHELTFDELQADILFAKNNIEPAYVLLKSVHKKYKTYNQAETTEQLRKLSLGHKQRLLGGENKVITQKEALQTAPINNQKGQSFYVLIIALLALGVSILIAILVYKNKLHHRNLKQLATTDELTGLYNRRNTLEHLDKQLDDAIKYKHEFFVAMVDLDWFKQVNDRFGHFMGDKVLRLFSDLCLKILSETETIGRVGGNRFLILLPHVDAEQAFQKMDDLRLKMAELTKEVNMPELVLTNTIGLCECSQDDTSEAVMRLVETALYRGKQNERNQVVLCDRR